MGKINVKENAIDANGYFGYSWAEDFFDFTSKNSFLRFVTAGVSPDYDAAQ